MITGSIVALVTPMVADGRIDWTALDDLIEWHIAEGTDAIVSVGTTGESPTLTPEEHLDVIRRTVQVVGGKIPVIAGSGSNSTREAIELTREALEIGADASLQVVPYYNKPTQEGMFQHFKAVADAVAIPLILYNVPGRTVADLLPETVNRLADLPSVIGIKEATGDLERGRQILDLCSDRLSVYSGDDPTAAQLMLMGAKGDISVTANVAPGLMHAMCTAAIQGNRDLTLALDAKLQTLHQLLFVEPNPIPVKWALYHMNKIESGIRLPLTPLAENLRPALEAALNALES